VLAWDAPKQKNKLGPWLKSTKNSKKRMLCCDSSLASRQDKTRRMKTRRASAMSKLVALRLKQSRSPSICKLRCCQKNRQYYLKKANQGRTQWDKMKKFRVLTRNKNWRTSLWIWASQLRPSHWPIHRWLASLLPWCWGASTGILRTARWLSYLPLQDSTSRAHSAGNNPV